MSMKNTPVSIKTAIVLSSIGCFATLPAWAGTQTLTVNGKTVTAEVADGYTLELLTTDLKSPRMLSFNEQGDLFMGSQSGYVYRLSPPYRSKPTALSPTFDYPHSVAFRGKDIFIASTEGVYKAQGVKGKQLQNVQRIADLPDGSGHSSRTVRVGPDKRIYVALGITGNCSDEYIGKGYAFDKQRGGVMVLDESNGLWKPFSTGLRNPVDFAWNAKGDVFATNNGPDHLGYDQPKEQFTQLSEGSFHGMPWFQVIDGEVVRDQCRRNEPPKSADQVVKPMAEFPARNAPMGLAFIPDDSQTMPSWAGDAVVALHGSWAIKQGGGAESRRPPSLVKVSFNPDTFGQVEPLVSGFQSAKGVRWSRPAGVAVGPDGFIYFTSDGPESALYRLKPAQK
jgi:glucose/arabinose dehydrogenase